MSYEKRPRFEVTIFAEPGGHAARLLQTDRWCVSSTLHAAIEAEVAERVAEALRSGERVSDMTVDKHLPASAYALESGAAVHAVLRNGEWRVSAKLRDAIEAEVAEALRSQLPEDAPENPKAWQGRGGAALREVWSPEKMRWSGQEAVAVVHANDRMWMLSDALRALCTEPPELTMPMRARREWRRLDRHARDYNSTNAAHLRGRATELRMLLIDSGEPL